jgi:hypothetical protein
MEIKDGNLFVIDEKYRKFKMKLLKIENGK